MVYSNTSHQKIQYVNKDFSGFLFMLKCFAYEPRWHQNVTKYIYSSMYWSRVQAAQNCSISISYYFILVSHYILENNIVLFTPLYLFDNITLQIQIINTK